MYIQSLIIKVNVYCALACGGGGDHIDSDDGKFNV